MGGATTPQSSPLATGIASHTDPVLFPEVPALVGAKTRGEGGLPNLWVATLLSYSTCSSIFWFPFKVSIEAGVQITAARGGSWWVSSHEGMFG